MSEVLAQLEKKGGGEIPELEMISDNFLQSYDTSGSITITWGDGQYVIGGFVGATNGGPWTIKINNVTVKTLTARYWGWMYSTYLKDGDVVKVECSTRTLVGINKLVPVSS